MIEFAILSQLKDEEYFIETWLDHYFNLGFQHIFLLDDQSKNSVKNIVENLKKPYINNITVIEIDFSQEDFFRDNFKNSKLYNIYYYEMFKVLSKQHYILNLMLQILSTKNIKWLMYCDLDEFLNLKNFNSIGEYINYYSLKYPDLTSIVFTWVSFGSGFNSHVIEGTNIYEKFLYSEKDIEVYGYGKFITKLEYTPLSEIHFPIINKGKIYTPYKYGDLIEFKFKLNEERVDHNLYNAYLSHYKHTEFINVVNRRMKREFAAMPFVPHKADFILNEDSKLLQCLNTSMLKYSSNVKDKKIKKIVINKPKIINLKLYNQKYNCNLKDDDEMIEHFYKNNTDIYLNIN